MIDLKQLRKDPARFIQGAKAKGINVDIERLLALDSERRRLLTQQESLKAEQNRLAKENGPRIGELSRKLKSAPETERAEIEQQLEELRSKPAALKVEIQTCDEQLAVLAPEFETLVLSIPLPPDADVPVGKDEADNVEIKRWNPPDFDCTQSFEHNRGFQPSTHIELGEQLGLFDIERGVKIAGARSYALTGMGMRLHQAVLRYAFDRITLEHGFIPMSVPVLVREECMVGTGFFPGGREQTYLIEEKMRGAGQDLYLTGTGEVGLMGLHADEILDESQLPLKYATVSTCFRREAGAAGRDTAGLYRIHQFDKVEQVIICRADEQESRSWHQSMIEIVEGLLQDLGLPYRLLQCCTGDLGAKNADMIDIECWMPGRGELDEHGRPSGAYGETHSASRLYDFQCRRLNLRYRPDGGKKGETAFCHSLNNTVAASPRLLIPILEMWQQRDGSINVPEPLRPYMGGAAVIEPVTVCKAHT